MGFPTALSNPQKAALRTSGYWQRTFACFNPGDIVFQCRANQTITSAPFKAFAWDSTVSGAYTDVWQNMVVFISSTTDYLKDYKYRGYVRLAPSATEFRIDLNATVLNDGDYITVLRDTDLNARVRQVDLVAGSVAYHNLPPVTTGLPSVVVLYDSDNDNSVAWTPAQTGIATAQGATISTYAWAVSGSGAYTISSASAQNPNFTFTPGYHYLVRLITTDSNGVLNFILVHVYAITRTFTAPVILPAAAGNITQDLESGYSGSISAYGGVSNLPYRTHAVVFCVEHFGDNSSTPIVTNVLMHGRLRSEDISNEGTEEGGAEQLVTYPIEGITSYLQRLKTPDDIIRTTNTPDEWGEIKQTTPFRMAVYYLFAYTTLLNIASFSAGDSLFDAWQIGGEPTGIDGGNAAAALSNILSRIGAAVNYAPDGELRCEITASLKTDRSALVTIVDLLVSDVTRFELSIDTSRQLAQTTAYGGTWNTTLDDFILYTALAPSIPYGDAPETREQTRELLSTNSTATTAATELKTRAGNDFAFNNPKWLFSADMLDSWRWLVATNYQRYTWTVAATYDLRAIAITIANLWQLQRVNITIGVDGTYGVSAEFVEETTFSDAQSIATQLPANLPQQNPILPILSDDPAFPDEPLWAFPTDTPSEEELQPIDAYSAYQSYSPFTPDQAAQAAQKQGTPNCPVFQHYMRNGGTTSSPFLTVAAAAYSVTVEGSGQLSTGWIQYFNMVNGLNGWGFVTDSDSAPMGIETPGTGIGTADNRVGIGYLRGYFVGYNIAIPNLTNVAITFNLTKGTYSAGDQPLWVVYDDGGIVHSVLPTAVSNGNDIVLSWATGGIAIATQVALQIVTSYDTVASFSGSSLLKAITLAGTGANPFTGDPAENNYGDSFYRFDSDNNAVLFDPTEGLLIDSAKPAVIPAYNPSHRYTIPYTGTGFQANASYPLPSYTGVANNVISLTFCKL